MHSLNSTSCGDSRVMTSLLDDSFIILHINLVTYCGSQNLRIKTDYEKLTITVSKVCTRLLKIRLFYFYIKLAYYDTNYRTEIETETGIIY